MRLNLHSFQMCFGTRAIWLDLFKDKCEIEKAVPHETLFAV